MTKRVGHVSLARFSGALFSSSLLLGAAVPALANTATRQVVSRQELFLSANTRLGFDSAVRTVTESRLGHKIVTDRHRNGTIEAKSFSNRRPDGTFDETNPSTHIVNTPQAVGGAAGAQGLVRSVTRTRPEPGDPTRMRTETNSVKMESVDRPTMDGERVDARLTRNAPASLVSGNTSPHAFVTYRDRRGTHSLRVDMRPDMYQRGERPDAPPPTVTGRPDEPDGALSRLKWDMLSRQHFDSLPGSRAFGASLGMWLLVDHSGSRGESGSR